MNIGTENLYYPRLLRRVQAILIDSVPLMLLIYAIAFLPPMGDWSFVKPLLFVAGVFVLEPGLVSLTGGTIGHHWMKIRVTRLSGSGNINLSAATIRFILKTALGWYSLVMVMTSRKHQALHDIAARSLVVYRTTDHLPIHEKLVDRPSLSETYLMPSWWRRAIVILAYLIVSFISYCVIIALFVSESCTTNHICMNGERAILAIGSYAWLFASGAIIVLGWRGKLFGGRRQPKT